MDGTHTIITTDISSPNLDLGELVEILGNAVSVQTMHYAMVEAVEP